MPDVGHVAVGMLAGRWWAGGQAGKGWAKPAAAFSFVSLLPDLDMAGRRLGFPDGDPLGHRGAFHSLGAALLIGAAAGAIARRWGLPARRAALWAAAVAASHGALDMLDTGRLGVAYLWPISTRRIFWPWRFLPGPPPGELWLSWEGARVVAVGSLYFIPVFILALWPRPKPAAGLRGS